MRTTRSCAFAFLALLGPLASQTATATTFGGSCPATGIRPLIYTAQVPRLNSVVTIDYAGPSSRVSFPGTLLEVRPWLALGLSDQISRGIPLPYTLPTALTQGLAGCDVLVSTDVVSPMPTSPPFSSMQAFQSAMPLAIPNAAGLIGLPVFAQWLVIHTSYSPTTPVDIWLQTSNALRLVLGT